MIRLSLREYWETGQTGGISWKTWDAGSRVLERRGENLPLVLGSDTCGKLQLRGTSDKRVDKYTLCSRHKWLAVQKTTVFGHMCASSVYHTDVGIFRYGFVLEEVSEWWFMSWQWHRGHQKWQAGQSWSAVVDCSGANMTLGYFWVCLSAASWTGWSPHSPYWDQSCCLSLYKFILSVLLWPLVKSVFLCLQTGKEDVEKRA